MKPDNCHGALDMVLPLPVIGRGETESTALSFITSTGHLIASFIVWVAWVHRFRVSLETSNDLSSFERVASRTASMTAERCFSVSE